MPIVKISDFLTRVKKPIDIKDDEHYKRITIKINHLGVLLRDIQEGHLIGTKKQFIVSKGQFILSKIDAMNGAFGIVNDDLDNAIITGNFWTFDFDENKVNLDWFNLFTSSNEFVEICRKASSGTTHRKYLDEKKFNNYELELPDKKSQAEVVEKIKAIVVHQEQIKNEIKNQIKTISELKQTILQDAIQGKLVSQDPKDEPAEKLLEKIKSENSNNRREKPLLPISKDEITFDLPSGWAYTKLGDIISISSGDGLTKKQMNEGDIPVYGGNGITGWHNNSNADANTLIIGRVGYYCGSIHKCSSKCWVTDNAFITKYSKNYIFTDFLFWLLKATNLKEDDNATAQPVISGRKVYPIIVAIPPYNEQKRIIEKVELLMKICDEQEKNIKNAKENINKLNQAILREMFN